jgi:hypothetical protein
MPASGFREQEGVGRCLRRIQLYWHGLFSCVRVSENHIASFFKTNVPVGGQDVQFEVMRTLDIKIAVFWAVTPCQL